MLTSKLSRFSGITILSLLVISLCFIANIGVLKSQTLDSTEFYKVILNVSYFNDGQVPDTLIGTARENGKIMPRFIKWGLDTTNNGIPHEKKFSITSIIYPSWKDLIVSCNLEKINPDTMTDVILFMWGRLLQSDSTYKDTATALVIFGQKGLDTNQQIGITGIQSFQIQPFVAMKLSLGSELTDGKVRDISQVPSYVLHSIPINTDTTISARKPNIETDQTNGDMDVKIYPNPAIYYTNIEINKIPPGTYTVRIVDLQGKTMIEQNVEVTNAGDLTRTLNLEAIPTGLYSLRIIGNEKVIGNFQIIVIQ